MIEKVLYINEIFVTRKPAKFICFGLGSCIGLFVVDRIKGLSGGAHIPLPAQTAGEFRDATEMIDGLLTQLSGLGSTLNALRAKVTGGAQIFKGTVNLGAMNSEAVLRQLVERKIFVAAKDLGGNQSRTAHFINVTGELRISTSEQKKYII